MMRRLTRKIALVTGRSRRIGPNFVAYLPSPGPTFITGASLAIDGRHAD